jgi:quercetin dioxygenase-like cupin family protein
MNAFTRFLLVAVALATPVFGQAPVSGAVVMPAGATKPRLTSQVFKWEDMPQRQTPVGERRDVADNPTATLGIFECHISTLNPGQASHLPHRHATEELIIIKEGKLEVYIDGNTIAAGPGSTLFYSSMDVHRVRNFTSERATYFVVNLATAATYATSIATEPVLPSRVHNYELLTAKPAPVGERRDILNGRTRTLVNLETHITTLKPGEANHAPHRHPDDEVVLLQSGTIEVNINGKLATIGPGSVVLFTSNDLHGMRNVGTTPASFHIIRMVTAATPKADPAAK